MEIKITQTETCKCGRAVISVAGTCTVCAREGADLFRAFMAGRITFGQFMADVKIGRKEGDGKLPHHPTG